MANQLDITDGVKIYSNLKDYIEEEMFMPLDNLLKTQNGERIKEKMLTELTLETGNWEGTQWVLPTALPELIGSSLRIERKLYEKAGGK